MNHTNGKPDRKPSGYWKNRANVLAELQGYLATREQPGAELHYSELRRTGQAMLLQAIVRHGGLHIFAIMVGLPTQPRPRRRLYINEQIVVAQRRTRAKDG